MPVPQTLFHDICSRLWDTNHPVGSLIIRSVLHDLIDQQRENYPQGINYWSPQFSVAITTIHSSGTHLHSQSLPPQWNMNEHPGWSRLLTMPWANAIGEAFLWLLSVQHPSSQEAKPFQVCYTKWKCWIWGGRRTAQTQIHESKACRHQGRGIHTP